MTPRLRLVSLIGILLLAAVARLWDLQNYPPGLFPDQAANGEDVFDILRGRLQFFSQRNNGRESLFFYLQAATVGLFGVGVWPMFLASALVGITTVWATYAAGAALLDPRVGLLASFFLATNPWHVTLSRTGFRAVTVPLFIALSLLFIAHVLARLRAPRRRDAVLAGLLSGLGLYTYGAYRAFALFLACGGALGVIRFIVEPRFRTRARGAIVPVALAAVIALVTVAPLLLFFARHQEFVNYKNRLAYLSVWDQNLNQGHPFRTLLRTTTQTLRGFVVNGDGNPRHNPPFPSPPPPPAGCTGQCGGGVPFLSPVPAVLGIVSLFVAAKRAPWLVGLFTLALVPAVVTAESIPHGLRTVGTLPAAVWLAGAGGVWFSDVVRRHQTRPGRHVWTVVVAVALLGTAGLDLWSYFGLARNSPRAYDEYRGDLTVVSEYLNNKGVGRRELGVGSKPYLVLDDFSVMTVRFLTTPTGYPYRLLKPEDSHLQALEPGEEIIFTRSTLPDAERYRKTHPDARTLEEARDRFGRTAMIVLTR